MNGSRKVRQFHFAARNLIRNLFALTVFSFTVVPDLAADTAGEIVVDRIVVTTDRDKTKENALRRFMDIREGDRFASITELEAAVRVQEQDLINERVFEEVSLVLGEIDGEEDHFEIRVNVVESITFVPIPYVSFDSNSGFWFGVETYYDNAWGTMTNWYLNAALSVGKNFDGDYAVTNVEIEPMLRDLKIGNQRYLVALSYEYTTNVTGAAETPTEHWTQHKTYLRFGTSWKFADDWYYSFYPNAEFQYGFDWNVIDPTVSSEDRYRISWYHDFGPHRIDFVYNNLRQGSRIKLKNALRAVGTADPESTEIDFRFVADVGFDGRVYYTLGQRLNFYHRLNASYTWNDINRNLGENLRGVLDGTVTGNAGIFQQNSFGIDIFHWRGVFDLQIHPFFDIGYTVGGSTGTTDELRYGFGTDIYFYIDKVSNLTLRATIGFDPTRDFAAEIIIDTGYSY